MLERALVLAYFLHGEKEIAHRIVLSAMTKLEVATAAQNKRLYYTPQGRSLSEQPSSEALRSKVSFSRLHLLQRLIYIESESYEIKREQAVTNLHQQDLLVHFIKHLVRICIKRNSFYVTLGISRLLYNYSTAETMDIYNLVIQDPGRVKDDYYYRSRKGILLREIKERFGDLVGTQRGPRGAENLRTQSSSERFASLVQRCLTVFMPWGTSCSVPAKFDPVTDDIPYLKYQGKAIEDETEVNRIHAVLDPDCYSRLIAALGLAPPHERLAVPHFLLSSDDDDHDTHRDDYFIDPPIDESDLAAIKSALAEQSNRRRKTTATLLRVMVDGEERARLDLTRSRRTSFPLKGTPELIEVRALDRAGEVVLASHVISYDKNQPPSQPLETSVITEGNQKIFINVMVTHDEQNEIATGEVEVRYKELNLFRALRLFAKRLKHLLTAGAIESWHGTPVWVRPVVLILLVAAVVAVIWVAQTRRPEVATQIDKSSQEGRPPSETASPQPSPSQRGNFIVTPPGRPLQSDTPSPPITSGTAPSGSPSPERRENIAVNPPPDNRSPRPPDRPPSREEERTRNPGGEPAAVSLPQVRRLFVQIAGAEPHATRVRNSVTDELRRTGRFMISDNPNDADAALRVTISGLRGTPGSEQLSLVARLINARGDVLWQSRTIRGDVDRSAARIVNNLLRDARRLSSP